jgi:hypothetical protein
LERLLQHFSFFLAEFFSNLGIHSKNVLMQYRIEVSQRMFFGTDGGKKNNKAKV